jgi:hypothetical protein
MPLAAEGARGPGVGREHGLEVALQAGLIGAGALHEGGSPLRWAVECGVE